MAISFARGKPAINYTTEIRDTLDFSSALSKMRGQPGLSQASSIYPSTEACSGDEESAIEQSVIENLPDFIIRGTDSCPVKLPASFSLSNSNTPLAVTDSKTFVCSQSP